MKNESQNSGPGRPARSTGAVPMSPTNRHDSQMPWAQAGKDRRMFPRYEFTYPVVVMPVKHRHVIEEDRMCFGFSWDISQGGMHMQLDNADLEMGESVLLAVEVDEDDFVFSGAMIKRTREQATGHLEIGAEFGGPIFDLFQEGSILPKLDTDKFEYTFPTSPKLLATLVKLGVVEDRRLDFVLSCPMCSSLPTVRRGCPKCMSSSVFSQRMIHHFACAHVDRIEQFETGDELACPKCRTRKMIVGTDFEYLQGPKRCSDCGHADFETITIGHCLQCDHRFDMERANNVELMGYHVNRLDPLAFVDPA